MPEKDFELSRLREYTKSLEQQIKELEARPSAGSSYSIAGVNLLILHIGNDDRIIYANSAFLKFFDFKREHLMGQPKSVLAKSRHPEIARAILSAKKKQKLVQEIMDGKGRHYQLSMVWENKECHVVVEDISEKHLLKSYLSRYVSADLDSLDDDDLATFKFPERRFMSVSFTDLRDFTGMSEQMSPDEVRSTINAFLDSIIRAVDTNKGTVDKIVGDEVMALYGAPKYYKDHALRAIITALDQQMNLKILQRDMENQNKKMPDCGIGINTGDMVVGNIGSESRQDYTVIGPSVNIAARLCGVARGGQVLLTEVTLKEVLANLPEGWVYKKRKKERSHNAEEYRGRSDNIVQLPEELDGLCYTFGPEDVPLYEMRYLSGIRLKGVEYTIPVIEALFISFSIPDPGSGALTDETVSTTGERLFGKYRLIELIGQGGMAEVWRARDAFGNDYAIKILLAGEGAGEVQKKRLMREAELMHSLDHRNICRITEVGIIEKTHFIAMELLRGVTLSDFIINLGATGEKQPSIEKMIESIEKSIHKLKEEEARQAQVINKNTAAKQAGKSDVSGPLREQHAIHIIDGILDAVQHAHDHGIVHRDLKPGNIMIKRNGEPVVMDFGLGRFEDSTHSMTMSAELIGTVDFMAPEQARSAIHADEQSDIFSAGAILYYMLTGKKWFITTGNILIDTVALSEQEVPLLRKQNRRIKKDLETIVLKAMEKDPKRRYQTAKAFQEDLRHYQKDEPISARPAGTYYKIAKKIKKHRILFSSACATVLTMLIASTFILGEKLKEFTFWGKPVFIEQFQDDSWKKNWTAVGGGKFSTKNGKLIAEEGSEFSIFYNKRFHGPVAIEFDGKIPKGTSPGDLSSVFFSRIDTVDFQSYAFQTGASDNQEARIAKCNFAGPEIKVNVLARNVIQNRIGRTYRIRAEKDGGRLLLFIDRKKVVETRDYFPFNSGYIGLYGYYSGKTYDNVKIFQKGVAEQVSALTAGDALYKEGLYAKAIREYEVVARSLPGKTIYHTAMYKKGLCLHRLKKYDKAIDVWTKLTGTTVSFDAQMGLIDVFFRLKRYPEFRSIISLSYANAGPIQKAALRNKLGNIASEQANDNFREHIDMFRRMFPQDRTFDADFAVKFNKEGMHQRVLDYFPEIKIECAIALYEMGRFKELYDYDHKFEIWGVPNALLWEGKFKEVLERFPQDEGPCFTALSSLGRGHEILTRYAHDQSIINSYYIDIGRYEEALKNSRFATDEATNVFRALVGLDREEEVLQKLPNYSKACYRVKLSLTFDEYIKGNRKKAGKLFEKIRQEKNGIIRGYASGGMPGIFDELIIDFLPVCEGKDVDLYNTYSSILDKDQFRFKQFLWNAAAFLSGFISEEQYKDQPAGANNKEGCQYTTLNLLKGMKSEQSNDLANALKYYKDEKLLSHRTLMQPGLRKFVSWRIKELSKKTNKVN